MTASVHCAKSFLFLDAGLRRILVVQAMQQAIDDSRQGLSLASNFSVTAETASPPLL
jgi:hypothetical protein